MPVSVSNPPTTVANNRQNISVLLEFVYNNHSYSSNDRIYNRTLTRRLVKIISVHGIFGHF